MSEMRNDPAWLAMGTEDRTAKLERLRGAIASGTYTVDLDALAFAFVTAYIRQRRR